MTTYVRRCPACQREHAPEIMRCVCGALLAGVDLVRPAAPVSEVADPPAAAPPPAEPPPVAGVCAHDDCGQTNPPGSTVCLYCNRPLNPSIAPPAPTPGLLRLPAALQSRYRIVKPLPAHGAEAELLLVECLSSQAVRVAKIYRLGIHLRPEVQQRLAQISFQHRVEVFDSGSSDGYDYEVMAYCDAGSLRELLQNGPLAPAQLRAILQELVPALAAVHAAGLLHRDLKPENILLRRRDPLELVLTDFAVSSLLDATQRFTSAARTLTYAAPESLSGVIDGKADYWAIGMILLEAVLGKHPFAGLSEAVILHHLTTRSLDLTAVHDADLRKLLRGLLLRDPARRWGNAELQRWLAGDPNLREPAESGQPAGFAEPYHLGQEVCHTMAQLAVALSRNWALGVADMANGLLLAWFRDVQKDQNAVRLLLELRFDSQMSLDLQLLKLILHLAPGIPPVWCGQSIELPAILEQANRALQGDSAAAGWLHQLYQNRVLTAYAEAGNLPCADLVERWSAAGDQFAAAWQSALAVVQAHAPAGDPDEYANFDQLVYGKSGPHPPALARLHARLLAMAYDAEWAERLRQRLNIELIRLRVDCPWLAELGEVEQMGAAKLLVVEALLPEAQAAVDRQVKANQRKQQAAVDECATLSTALQEHLGQIRSAAGRCTLNYLDRDLSKSIDQYHALADQIRASGRSDPAWQNLRNEILRHASKINPLQQAADELRAYQIENSGWLNSRVYILIPLALFLGSSLLGETFERLFVALVLGLAGWRYLRGRTLLKRVHNLAED